jgi:hypothetical protein
LKDSQPCADNDRQTGEGIKPVQTNTKFIKTSLGKLLVTLCEEDEFGKIEENKKIVLCESETFIIFDINTDRFIRSNSCINIYKH